MAQFEFSIPDDASELFEPYQQLTPPPDYEIPDAAISNSEPDEHEPEPLDNDADAITAPAGYGELGAAVDEALDSVLSGSTDDGGDEPPHDWDAAAAEFSDGETVLDMPEQEQATTFAEIERFAVAGTYYNEEYTRASTEPDTPDQSMVETGYKREVPRRALESEGVAAGCTVEAYISEPNSEDPYYVGVDVTRLVDAETESFNAQGEPMGKRTVEGRETKSFALAPTGDGYQVYADGELITSYRGQIEVKPPDENGEVEPIMISFGMEEAPLLTLREMRGILGAMRRAGENPEAYAPTEEGQHELLDQARVSPFPSEASTEDPEDTDAALTMPEHQRAELQAEMERFAADGIPLRGVTYSIDSNGQQHMTSMTMRYQTEITPEMLAAEGLNYDAGAVTVFEESEHQPYGVEAFVYREGPLAVEVPTSDGLPVRREVAGVQNKHVRFDRQVTIPGIEPVDLMTTSGAAIVSYPTKANPEEHHRIQNDEAGPLTQREAEALLRILRRANGGN